MSRDDRKVIATISHVENNTSSEIVTYDYGKTYSVLHSFDNEKYYDVAYDITSIDECFSIMHNIDLHLVNVTSDRFAKIRQYQNDYCLVTRLEDGTMKVYEKDNDKYTYTFKGVVFDSFEECQRALYNGYNLKVTIDAKKKCMIRCEEDVFDEIKVNGERLILVDIEIYGLYKEHDGYNLVYQLESNTRFKVIKSLNFSSFWIYDRKNGKRVEVRPQNDTYAEVIDMIKTIVDDKKGIEDYKYNKEKEKD